MLGSQPGEHFERSTTHRRPLYWKAMRWGLAGSNGSMLFGLPIDPRNEARWCRRARECWSVKFMSE
jgi:hypothetical protein